MTTRPRRYPEVFCTCGTSILFGPDATESERAHPTCTECQREVEAFITASLEQDPEQEER